MKRCLSCVLALVLSVFILFSVTPSLEAANLKKAVIDKWLFNVNGKDQIRFFEDGRVIVFIIASGNSVGGYYKFINDNRLRVDIRGGTLVFEIFIDKEGGLNLKETTVGIKYQPYKLQFFDLTVFDKQTKLMWTRDANITGKTNWNGAFKFIEQLNEQKYAGYNDWRLPTKEELKTLVDYAENETGNESKRFDEFLNRKGFKNVDGFTAHYWSSTIYDYNFVWVVSMDIYNEITRKRTDFNYVWPVRGGNIVHKQKDSIQVARFQLSKLTVLDIGTKLMWARDGNIRGIKMSREDASEIIKQLNKQKYAGYSDWRLPDGNELQTLVDYARDDGLIEKINEFLNRICFKNMQEDGYWLSNTILTGTGYKWLVLYMGDGYMDHDDKTGNYYVLPVRDGQ